MTNTTRKTHHMPRVSPSNAPFTSCRFPAWRPLRLRRASGSSVPQRAPRCATAAPTHKFPDPSKNVQFFWTVFLAAQRARSREGRHGDRASNKCGEPAAGPLRWRTRRTGPGTPPDRETLPSGRDAPHSAGGAKARDHLAQEMEASSVLNIPTPLRSRGLWVP